MIYDILIIACEVVVVLMGERAVKIAYKDIKESVVKIKEIRAAKRIG